MRQLIFMDPLWQCKRCRHAVDDRRFHRVLSTEPVSDGEASTRGDEGVTLYQLGMNASSTANPLASGKHKTSSAIDLCSRYWRLSTVGAGL
jgi:hypothetical protein